MTKIGLSGILLISHVTLAASASTPESLRTFSMSGLQQVLQAKPKASFKASRNIRLSGNVRLSGNAYAGQGRTRYVSIYVDGWASVYGADGVQSGQFRVSERVGIWVREGTSHYSEYVRISQNVPIYKNGKHIGSTYIGGSIRVSGWKTASSSWLRLSGSGSLSGSIFVRDEESATIQVKK